MRQSINSFMNTWSSRRIGRRFLAFGMAFLFVFTMIPVTAIAESVVKTEVQPSSQKTVQQPSQQTAQTEIQTETQIGVQPTLSAQSVFCGLEEHVHTDECYEIKLACGLDEEEAHIHTDKCYEFVKEFVCGKEEGKDHHHDDSCVNIITVYDCGLEEGEGAHQHTEACYAKPGEYICGLKEGEGAHQHTEACYETQMVLCCGMEETVTQTEGGNSRSRSDGQSSGQTLTIEHKHNEKCYKKEKVLICGQEENKGHVHSDACIQKEFGLICGKRESKGHVHTEKCGKHKVKVFCCGLTEGETHWHTDACVVIDKKLICDKQETKGHIHTEACYEKVLVCDKEEHTHSLACYSNPTADLVPKAAMASTVANVELTGNWAEDIVSVACSQVGYAESTENYAVTEQGQVKGYTQYGDWAGSPYGDWCAAFVSFCAKFAGITIPTSAGCQNFQFKLMEAGLYREVGEYEPKPGDIVFFRSSEKPDMPGHVGIVTGVTEYELETIEGNRTSMVDRFSYALDDESIMGYCEMPENPDYMLSLEVAQDAATPQELMAISAAQAPQMQTALYAQLVERQISDEKGLVTVSGMMPEGVSVTAREMTEEEIENLALKGYTVYAVYDIVLWLDGEAYEPEDPLRVQINAPELPQNLEVQHLAMDEAGKAVESETLTNTVTEEGVSFTTGGFSPFALVTPDDGSDDADGDGSQTSGAKGGSQPRGLGSGAPYTPGTISFTDASFSIPDTGYVIGNMDQKTVYVRYTNNVAFNGTVLVIEIPSISLDIAAYPSVTDQITDVLPLGTSRFAVRLADNSSSGSVAIDVTTRARLMTSAEAASIIDNGIPDTRFACYELHIPAGTALSTSLINSMLADPSQIPQSIYWEGKPDLTFAESDTTVMNTYDVTVSSDPALTNDYLARIPFNNDDAYNYLDRNHHNFHLRYSSKSIYQGHGLIEYTGLKVYVPDERLVLSSVSSVANTTLHGDYPPNANEIRQGSDLMPQDFTGLWGSWVIGQRQYDANGYYYVIRPASGTRYFNIGDALASTQFFYGVGLVWQLSAGATPLEYSATAYTNFQAANTELLYKTVGDTSERALSHVGPVVRTFARTQHDKNIVQTNARNKTTSNLNVYIGSFNQNFQEVAIDNTRSRYESNGVDYESFPRYTGAMTETYEFDYEVTAPNGKGVQVIRPTKIYLQEHFQGSARPIANSKVTRLASLSYTLKDGTTHSAPSSVITAFNNSIATSASTSRNGNALMEFSFSDVTETNYVTRVTVEWSALGTVYPNLRDAGGNTNLQTYTIHDWGDRFERYTMASGFDFNVASTDDSGNSLASRAGQMFRVRYTATPGLAGTEGTTYENANFLYYRLRIVPCPDVVGFDYYNGANGDYNPVYLDGSKVTSIGSIGLSLKNYGQRRTTILNPVITLSMDKVAPTADYPADITGVVNGFAFLTGQFTAAEKMVGWDVVYTTYKGGSAEQIYHVSSTGTQSIPLAADDVFTSMKLVYNPTAAEDDDHVLELPYLSNEDVDRVYPLMTNIRVKLHTVNPATGETIHAGEYTNKHILLTGWLHVDDCPGASVCGTSHQGLGRAGQQMTMHGMGSSMGRYRYLTLPVYSTRRAYVGVQMWVDPTGDAAEPVIYQGDSTSATWQFLGGPGLYNGADHNSYGGDGHRFYNLGRIRNYFPWDNIRPSVYIELTDPEMTVDLTGTYWFGYQASGDNVVTEYKAVTDPSTGAQRTFLCMRLRDGLRFNKIYKTNGTGVSANATWNTNDTVTAGGGGDYFLMDYGYTMGSPLVLAFDSLPGIREAAKSEGEEPHRPVGAIYIDFSQAAVNYVGSIYQSNSEKTGLDFDRTKYIMVNAVPDTLGLSWTSATGNKLFYHDGSSFKVYVNRRLVAGAELYPGKDNGNVKNRSTKVTSFYAHERETLTGHVALTSCADSGQIYGMTAYVTLPRAGLAIPYYDAQDNPQTETGGNLSLYLRGAPHAVTNSTGRTIVYSYTTDPNPGQNSNYTYDPTAAGNSWAAVTGIKIYVDQMDHDTSANIQLDLMADEKSVLGVKNAYAGGTFLYNTSAGGGDTPQGSRLALTRWTFNDYSVTGGNVFWDTLDENGTRNGNDTTEPYIGDLAVKLYRANGTLIDETTTKSSGGFNKVLKTCYSEAGQYILLQVPVASEGASVKVLPTKKSISHFSSSASDSDFPREESQFVTIDGVKYVKLVFSSAMTGNQQNISAGFVKLPKITAVNLTMVAGQTVTGNVTVTEYVTNTTYNNNNVLINGGYKLTYTISNHLADYMNIATIDLSNTTLVRRTSTTTTQLKANADYSATGVAPGNYKVQATLKNVLGDEITRIFKITVQRQATITVNDQTYTYTGSAQGEDNVEYSDAAVIAEKITASGLNTGDYIAGIILNGQQIDVGTYTDAISATEGSVIIKNSSNQDVTANYNIVLVPGSLTIDPAPVTLTAASDTYSYTGSEQILTGFTASVEGLTFPETVTANGSGTVVGEYDVTFSGVTVGVTSDTTGNYVITGTTNGTLTIVPKSVTITVSDASKTYGDADPAFTGTVEGLVDETDLGTITYSRTNDAETADTYEAVLMAYYADNSNYTVTVEHGDFVIEPKALTITADSDSKTYDGTALTKSTYTYSSLAVGDSIESVTVTGSQTQAGTSDNVPSAAVIRNASNENVTSSYDITYEDGTLTVAQRPLTIRAFSDEKTYDGTPLTNTDCEITAGTLADGDSLDYVTITGSQTNAGSSANVPSEATILNGSDVYVSDSYDITYENGTLTVTKKSVTITVDSSSKTYGDADPVFTGTIDGLVNDADLGTVTYTRTNSDVNTVGTYNDVLTANYTANDNYTVTVVLGSFVINKRDVIITVDNSAKVYGESDPAFTGTVTGLVNDADLGTITYSRTNAGVNTVGTYEDVLTASYTTNANYNVTVVPGDFSITKAQLTITANPQTYVYNGLPQGPDGTYTTGISTYVTVDGLQGSDAVTSITVSGNKINKGEYPNWIVPSQAAVQNSGTDVAANYEIVYVPATLTITADPMAIRITSATTSWTYDGTLHTDATYTVTYGGASMPADATGTVFTLPTGDTITITPTAAGVRYYDDDYSENNTFTYVLTNADDYDDVEPIFGTLSIDRKQLTITAGSAQKAYDGSALTNATYTNTALAAGDSFASVTVTGSQTLAGSSANVPSAALIRNTSDVDVTDSYDITYVSGTLTVTANDTAIVITSATHSWPYDGITHTDETYSVTYGGVAVSADATGKVFTLPTGDTITITATAIGVEDYDASYNENNTFTYVLTNASSYSNGTVTPTYGTLSITKREVRLTAASEVFTYDGTTHSNDGYTATGLIGGDTISAVVTGSITFVSESPVTNELTSWHFDIGTPDNYRVTVENGTLAMTAANVPITITAASQAWIYDGAAHTNTAVTVTSGSLLTGDELRAVATGSATNVADTSTGNNPIAAGYSIMHGTEDVTANYAITPVNGTLTINARPVTFTGRSETKAYNAGNLITINTLLVTPTTEDEGLLSGHTHNVTFSASGSNAGTYTGTITAQNAVVIHDAGSAVVTGNYDIKVVNGTLTIVAMTDLTVSLDSAVYMYDAENHCLPNEAITNGPSETTTIEYQFDGTSIWTTDLSLLTKEAAGTYTIRVKATNTNYTNTATATATLTIEPRPVTITAGSYVWSYDGESKNWVRYIAEGLGSISKTFYVTMTPDSIITDAGSRHNVIATVDNVPVSTGVPTPVGNFLVTTIDGLLTVDPAPVTLTGTNDTRPYNGLVQTLSGYTCSVDGLSFSGVSADVSAVDVGTHYTEFTGVVLNETRDTTNNYVVTKLKDGYLKITPAPLTITGDSNSKEYDGTPLTDDGFTDTAPVGLQGTDYVYSVTMIGSVTYVGTAANTPREAVVKNGDKDVTANYTITYVRGTLEVTQSTKVITITSDSDSWNYDGQTHKAPTYTVTYGTWSGQFTTPEGERMVYATLPTGDRIVIAERGDGYNGVRYWKSDEEYTENNRFDYWWSNNKAQYANADAVEKTFGYLRINKIPLTLTAGSASKVYDGTKLTAHTYEITEGSLAEGDRISNVTFAGSLIAAGRVDNTISSVVIRNAEDTRNVTNCYDITKVNGELRITPIMEPLVITSSTKHWTYDGQNHIDQVYTVTLGGQQIPPFDEEGKVFRIFGYDLTIHPHQYGLNGLTNHLDGGADNNFWIAYSIGVNCFNTIERQKGKLYVDKKPVTITAASDTFTYDGTAHSNGTYTVEGLVGDDSLTATVTGSITFPNQSPVKNTVKSHSFKSGKASNYQVSYVDGELKMVKASVPITITAGSYTWTYNAQEHTYNYVKDSSGSLLTGDELFAEATGSVTNVSDTFPGNNPIKPGYKILHFQGEDPVDVTENYVITEVAGTLTINKRPLTIKAIDKTYNYNATLQGPNGTFTGNDISTYVTATGLAGQDKLTEITVSGQNTNAGTYNNWIAPSGAKVGDKTDNYKITYTKGKLTINKKSLEITADSATKEYDGIALTKNTYKFTHDTSLAEGDKIVSVIITGKQLIPGSSSNVASKAVIQNRDGKDVTGNYSMKYVPGTLTVTKNTKKLLIESATKSWEYDGQPHTELTYTVTYDGKEIEGKEKDCWIFILPTNDIIEIWPTGEAKEGVTYFKQEGYEKNNTYEFNLANEKYYDNVVYAYGTLSIDQRELVVTACSAGKEYDGKPLTCDEIKFKKEQLAKGEWIGDYKVIGSITYPGEEKNVIDFVYVFNDNKEDVTWNYDIKKNDGLLTVKPNTTKIVIESATNSWEYDGKPHKDDSYTVTYGKQKIKPDEGNPLFFKLPTGDSIEILPMADEVKNYKEDYKENNTFDIKLINDGFYEGVNLVFGTLSINRRQAIITAASKTWVYDGKDHTCEDLEGVKNLVDGEKVVEIKIKGSQREAGKSDNVPSDACIWDGNGEDETNNYEIKYVNGILEVVPTEKRLEIVSAKRDWTYDGEVHTEEVYRVYFDGEEIPMMKGDTMSFMLPTEDFIDINPTEEGVVDYDPSYNGNNTFDFKLSNEKSYSNVQSYFGTLFITPKDVTITADSETFTYDGTAHSNPNYKVEGLVGDDKIKATVEGTITNVYENPVENRVTSWEVVTGIPENYNVIPKSGILWMKPSQVGIIIESAQSEWTYDGAWHTDNTYQVRYGDTKTYEVTIEPGKTTAEVTLPLGDVLVITTTATGVRDYDAEYSENNTFEYTILQATDGKEVTDNYGEAELKFGTLSILKASLTITADSNSKEYDGTPLRDGGWEDTAPVGLAPGDRITNLAVTGEALYPGESVPNVPDKAIITNEKGDPVRDNYEIEYVNGTLTIDPLPALVQEGQHFRPISTTNENATISQDSSYTVRFKVIGSDPNLVFTRTEDGKTVPVQLPAGTTIIMVLRNNKVTPIYLYRNLSAPESSIAISGDCFSRMGAVAGEFPDSEMGFEAQFVIDFSQVTGSLIAPGELDATIRYDGIDYDITETAAVTLVNKATFDLQENTDNDDVLEKLTVSCNAGERVNSGRATIWDDREKVLVITPTTALPSDARLLVNYEGDTAVSYGLNANGKFIIPLEKTETEYEVKIELWSEKFPRLSRNYAMTASLMVSNSLASESPMNGMMNGVYGQPAATQNLVFRSPDQLIPSLKITTDKRAYHPGETAKVNVETLNTVQYGVVASLYRKNGNSWDKAEEIVKDVPVKKAGDKDGIFEKVIEVTIPNKLTEDESYMVVATVVDSKGNTIMKVPYYFLGVRAE